MAQRSSISIDLLARRKFRPARLVIADPHEVARAGLRAILAGQRGLEIVGEAVNGREALRLCRHLQPDLVLIEVRMPELDGLMACRLIKQECPGISVILVTALENPEYLLEAIKAGAAGYVLKNITQHEFVNIVRCVLQGESILSKELLTDLVQHLESETPSQVELPSCPLSPREREVLQLLAQGQTNHEIAHNLTISVSTVKIHIERILAKLGVSDCTQAAVRGVELGLLRTASKQ